MAHVASRGQVAGSRRFGLLPAEATSFVGRTMELAGITALLGSARMVSVTGPAGVGKTRISVCAASMAADQYPDGMFFADLAGISDPALLAGAVAAALGVPDGAGPRVTALASHVRDKKLLLILDTCEHLVDACAALADRVLRCAPRVTLLATSRQPLDAPGEHAFPLLPLPAEADAVDLFAQRAAAVVPGFTVTPRNRADIVALCRRLDGLPLAVELAAVRLRALPLTELGRQLESGIRTLTVSRRGTSPRHQTLRAAVEWSYRLCGPAERALWQRLSVFAETFDVAGAEQVCAGGRDLPRDQVLPALVGLVDKSVVARDAAEPARYRMLGVLREYGADRLAEAEGPELYLDRQASWALALARDFDEQFRHSATATALPVGGPAGGAATGSQEAALRRIRREYQSIATVLGRALGPLEQPDRTPGPGSGAVTEQRQLGAELALAMAYYWQTTGMFAEGRQWLGRAASVRPDAVSERAWLLSARGRLTTLQGDVAGALPDIEESIRLALAAGPDARLAAARGFLHLTLALTVAGRTAEALAAGENARQRLTDCGDRSGLAGLELQLGYLHQLTGNCDEAVECSARGLALLGEAGRHAPGNERWLSGWLYLTAGLALAQRPDRTDDSAAALRRALASAHEIGDVVGTAHAVEALGWVAARGGQYERAACLLGAADQLWARTGRRLSGIAAMEEQHQQAVQAARKSLGERRYTAAYAHGGALDLAAVVRSATDDGTASPAGRAADGAAAGHAPPAIALLTKREREIGELVASGLSNREIASRLFISKRTVDAHVDHIFSKLEISSRVQLTVLLREPGQRRGAAASSPAG